MKQWSTDWKKVFANHISGKRLMFKIHRKYIQLKSKKKKKIFKEKNGQRTKTDILQRRYTDGQKVYEKMLYTSLIIREMQAKTIMSYHLTLVRRVIIKKIRNNKCWWGCGEKEPLCIVVGNWYSRYRKQYGGLKIKTGPIIWSWNSISGYLSEENKNTTWKDTCTPRFTAALVTRAKTWI